MGIAIATVTTIVGIGVSMVTMVIGIGIVIIMVTVRMIVIVIVIIGGQRSGFESIAAQILSLGPDTRGSSPNLHQKHASPNSKAMDLIPKANPPTKIYCLDGIDV